MKQARFISLLLVAAAAMLWSCEKHPEIEPVRPDNDGKGIGQMVMFSGGTTTNRETKADGKTYYMPDTYRFVCRMYYKAQTGSDYFDVEGGTDQTAWLKVDGNVGNSLYWNKDYTPVNPTIHGKGGVDDYGNDYSATAFYWQNRKEHAFLAWTDLNKAVSIKYGTKQGTLKFGADKIYKVYTGEKEYKWETLGYKIHGLDQYFTSPAAIREYVESTYTTEDAIRAFNEKQEEIGSQYDWSEAEYHYQYGWSCKYTSSNCKAVFDDEMTHETYGWYQYQMFFDKVPFEGDPEELGLIPVYDSKTHEITFYKNAEGEYVVAVVDGNNFQTDAYGNILYDESTPRFKYYFTLYREKQLVDVYDEFPALAFDLTRGTKTNMGQQPDIAQALEIQAPVGATQESNRVNLYFKHMFSQVQVNIKNAADNSVVLDASDIQKVELLGVSEEGYIFTDIDAEGNVKAAAYKEIDFSQYTEEQLKENTYGTAFQMFELPSASTETGYLKSFNAITFGQLQAIRMTWKEKDTEYTHAATFRIPDTEHMNLKSGTKYVWNIEVRRGTLAIIRTEIIDWEYPDDEEHNGHTSGTIIND